MCYVDWASIVIVGCPTLPFTVRCVPRVLLIGPHAKTRSLPAYYDLVVVLIAVDYQPHTFPLLRCQNYGALCAVTDYVCYNGTFLTVVVIVD